MKKLFYKKIAVSVAVFVSAFQFSSAHAAFPYDLDSGVVFIEGSDTASRIKSFTETSVLNARISGSNVILDHSKKRSWPKGSGSIGSTNLSCCNANAWAFIKVGDTWYGGTWEFLRVGQTTKLLSALRGPSHLRFSPLSRYQPRQGDIVGLMTAGITRNGLRNINERSNIVFHEIGGGVVSYEELGFIDPSAPIVPSATRLPLAPILNLINEED